MFYLRKRIVLELKDKLKKEEQIAQLSEVTTEQKNQINKVIIADNKVNEAISALQVLGYQRKDIEKIIEQIDTSNLSVEEIIKQGLKLFSN